MSKREEQKEAQFYVRSMSFSIKEEISYDWDYSTDTSIEVKVFKNTGSYEAKQLQRPDPLKSASDLSTDSVNAWFEGAMGMSATRLNPGQRFYFSPVGYLLKITNDKEVLANFRADGNVGTRCRLEQEDEKGRTAIQNICLAILESKEIPEDLLREHTKLSITDIDNEAGVKLIQQLMEKCQSRGLGDKFQECLRQAATESVVGYYKFKGHQSRYIQSGLITDDKFDEVESLYRDLRVNSEGEIIEPVIGKKPAAENEKNEIVDDKGKYTESVVHCTASNLHCVFASIDTTFIKYGTNIDDAWKITDSKSSDKAADALAARLKSMQELHNELKVANPALKFSVLDDKGKLYTTSEEKHITALLQICKSKADNWEEKLVRSVQENFTPEHKAKDKSQPSEDLIDKEAEEKERDIFNVSDDWSGLAIQSKSPISMTELLVTHGITASKCLVKPAIISTLESHVSLTQSSS